VSITLELIFVCLTLPLLAGIPICHFLLQPFESATPERWLLAPFLGIAFLVIFAQNLLYLGFKISDAVIPILILIVIGWAILFLAGRRGWQAFKTFPLQTLLFALLVYFIHAIGLLIAGADLYVGQGWVDQYNYVAQAQYFLDFGFHAESATNLYQQTAEYFKADRIGQSVFHALAMAVSGTDAKTAFMPVIYIGPFLTVFSISFLAQSIGLPRGTANIVALLSAVLPGTTLVALESFLSQSMGTPFLLLFPVLSYMLFRQPGARVLFCGALIFSTLASIYTELIPLAVLVILLSALFAVVAAKQSGSTLTVLNSTLISLVALTFVAFALNPIFMVRVPGMLARTTTMGVLSEIYPWAFSAEGYARLVLGDLVSALSPNQVKYIGYGIVKTLMIVSFIGLTYSARRAPGRRAIILGISALMIVPFAVFLLGRQGYSYQFYKLLNTVAPLFLISCYVTYSALRGTIPRKINFLSGLFAALSGGLLVAATAINSTLPLDHHRAYETKRGGSYLIATPAFQSVERAFNSLRQQTVWIAWHDLDLWEGGYVNGWLHYLARYNKIWSANISKADFVPNPAKPERPAGGDIILVAAKPPSSSFQRYLILGAPPFYIYRASSAEYETALALLKELTAPERYAFAVQIAEPPTYYPPYLPVLISGAVGNADLLTVGFSRPGYLFFRYDRWGVPPKTGIEVPYKSRETLNFDVALDRFDRTLKVFVGDKEVLAAPLYLNAFVPQRGLWYGINAGFDTLEGRYQIAKEFAGLKLVRHRD